MLFPKVKKIKIFGHEFEVIYNNNQFDLAGKEGCVDWSQEKVFINDRVSASRQSEILIHECFHIGDYFAKIKDDGEEMSEAEVTRAANFITALEFEYMEKADA